MRMGRATDGGSQMLIQARHDGKAAAEEGEAELGLGPHDGGDFGVGVVLGAGEEGDVD